MACSRLRLAITNSPSFSLSDSSKATARAWSANLITRSSRHGRPFAVWQHRPSLCAATLATTLNPTLRLLEAKAQAAGKDIKVKPVLVASAYERLMAGDKDGHDTLLVEALSELARETEVVVLAQASMARVLPRLPEQERAKMLSSPRLGMEAVRQALKL